MILADTTVWIDHLRSANSLLHDLLDAEQLLIHPFIIGELALGHIRRRRLILATLEELPAIHISDPEEVLTLIEQRKLVAIGIGYVDAHLLASTITTPGCQLWTRDRRLAAVADGLGVAANPVN
jgi:predicted nucleic acid-binding protein